MPAGEKSGNPRTKHHRATRIAAAMRRRGATRAQANKMATAAMDREYASSKGKRRAAAVDMDAHDSRSGQRKTNLTTKRGAAVSGASKPSAARKATSGKRGVRATGRCRWAPKSVHPIRPVRPGSLSTRQTTLRPLTSRTRNNTTAMTSRIQMKLPSV